jgi:poly(hydroxyalkanoate) depolymerase family esterase
MRTLADTIERLARLRARPQGLQEVGAGLQKLDIEGSNPGELSAWYRMPEKTKTAPALVVVLHGCTQNAGGYDRGSGWSDLAEAYGFAVLFPEQTRQNNGNLCFNWFVREDVTRGSGEVLSIRQMIATMVARHGVDARRVYVTGLSAGGAMANSLLATYPEVFAGGAVIAGLAHGVASSVPEAFDRMRGHNLPKPEGLQALVASAAPKHAGPWPTISVWQGTSDQTVADVNAKAIIDQWRDALGVETRPARSETLDGQERLVWTDATGHDVLDLVMVKGMGHGTPLDTSSGCGEAAPYMLDVGISSTIHIARGWGLIPSFEMKEKVRATAGASKTGATRPKAAGLDAIVPDSIKTVIETALRSAGLLK